MNRTTFELLAKWIAREHQTKIVFDPDCTGAKANMKTNEIFMPNNLQEHNILAALALLMHEAAHIKHSKIIPTDLVKGHISRHILNAIEDTRIDNYNMQMLNNIRYFYEKLLKHHVYDKKEELKKENLMTKCLINAILRVEGFSPGVVGDTEVDQIEQNYDIPNMFWKAKYAIEQQNWPDVITVIEDIKKIFKITDEMDYPVPEEMMIEVFGIEGDPNDLGVNKFLKPSSAWDKGDGITGPSKDIVGEAAFQELTRNAFKELLNIKQKKIVYDGDKINTNEITTFFTGDLETLFHEEDIDRVKKSKIVFCLDASGSMTSHLLDNTMRSDTLVKTIKSIENILKELQELEGLNIKYDIWAFDDSAEKLNINNWVAEYTANGGGTNILESFQVVHKDLMSDQEIDGNRIIILVTDGEVSMSEIAELKQYILNHGGEIKCMIVGVGASIGGTFVRDIVGDNNILAEDNADTVIMDCIRTMLE